MAAPPRPTSPPITPWNYNADLIDPKQVIAQLNAQGKLQITPGTLRASIDFIIWLQQAFNGITQEDVTNVFVAGGNGNSSRDVTNTFIAGGTGGGGSNLNARVSDIDVRLAFRATAPPPQTQIHVCTQATFPALDTLAPNTFIYVSDYAHLIFYSGSGTTFADDGSDYYAVAAQAPNSVGWHAVDGSTVNYLKADGSLGSKVLVDVVSNPSFLKVGTGTDTLIPAVAPGFTGSLDTGSVDAGTGAPATFVTDIGTLAVDATGQPANFYSQLWFRL